MPDLITKRDYKKLLTDLQRIIREGTQDAERAATQALIESYWSIGKRIAKEKLNTRAAYHNAILTDLSVDLDIGLRTLQRTVTFYQTYKRPPRVQGLSWAHFRLLMQLQDPAERTFYESLAATDADSLLLDIDLGFEVIRRQRIRLARIDAPPRDTPEGAAGRRFASI